MAYLREVSPGKWFCQYSLPKVDGKYRRRTVRLTGTRAEIEGELSKIEAVVKLQQRFDQPVQLTGKPPTPEIPLPTRSREPPSYVMFGDYAAIDRELLIAP